MPSSISSSKQRLPTLQWPRVLGGALLIFLLFVVIMELRLALRGFRATVLDSESRWIDQRFRASRLGERALILIGGSRMQLAADLDALRSRTGLEPVQLAIDGSSFLPVLEGLAKDDSIRGTVLVDFSDHLLTYRNEAEMSYLWQSNFDLTRQRASMPGFQDIEGWLSDAWRQQLRSYADGAQPLTSLLTRILSPKATQQYLITLPNRSRLADYSKVEMPGFYYSRVIRNLGQEVPITAGMTLNDFEQELRKRIEALQPTTASIERYEQASQQLAAQTAAIQARGGRVYFLMMPKSGWVKAIDDRRFPQHLFWDRFAATVHAPTLHFEDVPAWNGLQCPDGSHLDIRQRLDFTNTLVDALSLNRAVP